MLRAQWPQIMRSVRRIEKKTITIKKFSKNLYNEIKSDENETDTWETKIPFQL